MTKERMREQKRLRPERVPQGWPTPIRETDNRDLHEMERWWTAKIEALEDRVQRLQDELGDAHAQVNVLLQRALGA